MATDVHREPTLPVEELVGDKRSLRPYARRLGRPDCSITVDEYVRFLDEHDWRGWTRRDPEWIRKLYEPLARFYAMFPTWQEGRRALILGERLLGKDEAMTAEQKEMRVKLMGIPVALGWRA